MPRYRTTLRPPSFGGLPQGVGWRYVEVPTSEMSIRFVGMPISRHLYGVIETDRELTQEELEHFDIVAVP